MSVIPSHIQMLYLLCLKKGYTVEMIKSDVNGVVFDYASHFVMRPFASYKGPIAVMLRDRVMDFAKTYEIIQK